MADNELADRLFVPWERLGWEFVPPAAPAPSPDADREPVWVEPPEPELKARKQPGPGQKPVPAQLLGCLPLVTILLVIGGIVSDGTAVLGPVIAVVVLLVVLAALAGIIPALRRRAALDRFREDRDAAYAAYLANLASWRERVAAHDEQERQRHAAATRWFPLTSWSRAERIDVFGGTGDGWASLLVTLGCSQLRCGADILVLDLTEQQVAGALAEFAARQGHPVRHWELPTDWSRWHPLAGLLPDELSELLVDAVHTLRQPAGTADVRALDAELLAAVIDRLGEPLTFRRITAGLQVVRRVYDHDANGVLDDDDVARLTGAIDAFGHTERVHLELQFLTSVLDLLAGVEHDQGATAGTDGLWHRGVTVVSTAGGHRRRKDVLDRVVLHRVVRALRERRGRQQIVAVAGADGLGRESLEELTREADRAGVRLVLMVERLRGELHELLGGRDSATLLMRLGNAREATTAAEFIGRGHRFVLNQLTEQIGATFTEGVAASYSFAEGESETESRGMSNSRAITSRWICDVPS